MSKRNIGPNSIGEALDMIMAVANYPGNIEELLNKRKKAKGVTGLEKKKTKKAGTSEGGWYFLSGAGKRVKHYNELRDMFARYFERHGTYPDGCGDILKRFMSGIDNNVTVTELAKLEKVGMFEFEHAFETDSV